MKRNGDKISASGLCHYCDYRCRKGHRCSWYKRWVKRFRKRKRDNMKYNDLQDKCKVCEHMKPWALDMGGNHSCMCKEHQLDYFNKRTDKCPEYQKRKE